ncbi:JAB domain-containing protein, partial [Escherichia coli]
VLGAPLPLLQEVKGVGEAVAFDLKLVASVSQRMLKSEIRNKQVLSSWSSVIDYCHAAMAHETREQFRILFLDKRNVLI